MTLQSEKFRLSTRLQEAAENSPPLRPGEEGQPVKLVQEALVEIGYSMPRSTDERTGELDGIYGRETMRVVREFELELHGQDPGKIDLDRGIAGRQVLHALDARIAGGSTPLADAPRPEPETRTLGHLVLEMVKPRVDRDVEELTGDGSLESELDEIIDAYSNTRLGVAYVQEAFSLFGEYVLSATVRHAIAQTSLVLTAVTLPLAAVLYYRALLRANLAGPEAWGVSWGSAYYFYRNVLKLPADPLDRPISELPPLSGRLLALEPSDPARYLVGTLGLPRDRVRGFTDFHMVDGFYPKFVEAHHETHEGMMKLHREREGAAHGLLYFLSREGPASAMMVDMADSTFRELWGPHVSQPGR